MNINFVAETAYGQQQQVGSFKKYGTHIFAAK